jgi:hypothetical protein
MFDPLANTYEMVLGESIRAEDAGKARIGSHVGLAWKNI